MGRLATRDKRVKGGLITKTYVSAGEVVVFGQVGFVLGAPAALAHGRHYAYPLLGQVQPIRPTPAYNCRRQVLQHTIEFPDNVRQTW